MQTQIYLIFNAKIQFPGSSDLWNKTQRHDYTQQCLMCCRLACHRGWSTLSNDRVDTCFPHQVLLRFGTQLALAQCVRIENCQNCQKTTPQRTKPTGEHQCLCLTGRQPFKPYVPPLHAALLSSHFSQVPYWHVLLVPWSRPAQPLERLQKHVLGAACPTLMVNSISEREGWKDTRQQHTQSPCWFAWWDPCHPMQSQLFCRESVSNISLIHAHKVQTMPEPFVMAHLACSPYFSPLHDTESLWHRLWRLLS